MAIIKIDPIASVADLIEAVQARRPTSGFLTFRGQRNRAWTVEAGIYRPPLTFLAHEKSAVRDIQAIHPQEFVGDRTMFDRLVRMQHYSLPTRLMDVTANPLVALYFATEPNPPGEPETEGAIVILTVPESRKKYYDSDAVSCLANLSNLTPEEKQRIEIAKSSSKAAFNKSRPVDRLLQFIRDEKPHFRAQIELDELFRANYVVPKQSNRRILAQAGAFLIYGISNTATRTRELIKVQKLPVSKDAKGKIRLELELLGIDGSTLFPEIESAARHIAKRYGA